MKSIFTFFSGMLLMSQLSAQTVVLRDTCLPLFRMEAIPETATCNASPATTFTRTHLQLLGKRLMDGFTWSRLATTPGGTSDYLFARNGTITPPAGVVFRTCAANWTYFKVEGYKYQARPTNATEYSNLYARVRYFGNEQNPDSLRIEFSGALPQHFYGSISKEIVCDKCLATDVTPPVIQNCPTKSVPFKWTSPQVTGNELFSAAGLQASDNCMLSHLTTFPYVLTNAQVGQIVDCKTIAYDQSGNSSVCKFKVAFTKDLADTCFPSFKMVGLEPTAGCNAYSVPRLHGAPTYKMLGKRIADGFSWFRYPLTLSGSHDYKYARNGSIVPPTGVIFRNCPANWTYFKVVGFFEGSRPPAAREHINLYARVRYFGNERNPDSIRVEFSNDSLRHSYASFQKDTFCNKCFAKDHISPVIRKCPTQTITDIWTSPSVFAHEAIQTAGLNITDNCGVEKVVTFPAVTRNVQVGQTIAYKTVAYDASGNSAACKFKVLYEKPLADTCLPRFAMADNRTNTCNDYAITPFGGLGSITFQMLGQKLSDGFTWAYSKTSWESRQERLYARNGTTTVPAGIPFRSCPGNWIYFKLVGWNFYGYRWGRERNESKDVYARVRYFGNERNPDSIWVDLVGALWNDLFFCAQGHPL